MLALSLDMRICGAILGGNAALLGAVPLLSEDLRTM